MTDRHACAHISPLLEDYFEGTLSRAKATGVADHLLVCSRCAAELSAIEQIASALAAVPRAAVPDDLLQSITSRVAALPAPAAPRPVTGWRWLGLLAAASMAALALIAYLLPVVISAGLQSQSVNHAFLFLQATAGAAGDILVALWSKAAVYARGLGLAGKTLAPTLGLYAAAQLGVLFALVFALRAGRQRRLAHHLLVL